MYGSRREQRGRPRDEGFAVDDGSATLSMLIEQARRAAEDRVKVSAAYDFRQVRPL